MCYTIGFVDPCYIICSALSGEMKDNQSDASMENRRIHTVNFGCQVSGLTSCCSLSSLSVASLTQIFIIFVLRPHKSRATSPDWLVATPPFVVAAVTHSHCHIILGSFSFFFFGERAERRVVVGRDGRMTVSFASRASLQEHMTKTLKI